MTNKFILNRVLAACEKTLYAIDQNRENRKNYVLKNYGYERKYFGLFGPKLYPAGKDAQLKLVQSRDDGDYAYTYAKTWNEGLRVSVTKILLVAKSLKDRCFDDINLTTEEFSYISEFYFYEEN
jgi:hypothetical protein